MRPKMRWVRFKHVKHNNVCHGAHDKISCFSSFAQVNQFQRVKNSYLLEVFCPRNARSCVRSTSAWL